MTRVSFTGPSRLPEGIGSVCARDVVWSLGELEPTEFTTGGARGWDVTIARAAMELYPRALHRIVCPGAPFDAAAVRELELFALAVNVAELVVVRLVAEKLPGGAYRRRNEALVGHGDVLSALVRHPTFYRSGEWMTVNIARRAGVEVRLADLSLFTTETGGAVCVAT